MQPHAPLAACATLFLAGAPIAAAAGTPQIPFVENRGQLESADVAYYARLDSGTLFVTREGALVYALRGPRRDAARAAAGAAVRSPGARWSFRESVRGARSLRPAGAEPSEILVSRFTGPDPDGWHSRLRAFDRVELGAVAPGIRVELRAAGDNVEKLVRVAPGADLAALSIAVDGVDGMRLDAAGRLALETGLGDVVFTAPEAWQVIDGERRPVAARYVLSEGAYGFALGEHDPGHAVVVDPLLASTFLGGANPSPPGNYDDDIVEAMATFGDLVYVAGATQSPDFPVHLGYDETLGSNFPDAFVTLLTGDLSTVVASTFLGTETSDRVEDIAIDATGAVVVTGQAGWGFPVTPGAYTYSGTTPAGGGFVARLSPDLSTLEASAIVTPSDYPRALALGGDGVYFGGSTNNPNFPITPGAYRTSCCPAGSFGIRPYEGFAGRLSADFSTLEALTYLGGNTVSGMAVAADGSVLVTDGFDYAVTGYVARFDPDLMTRPGYLSYYPGSTSGSSRTYFNDVLVDGGTVVVVGQTYMDDLPATPGAFDPTCGTDGLCDGVGPLLVPRSDGFVARYTLDLQDTLALTYLGGSGHESARALARAADGDLVVVGETVSVDFPTTAGAADDACGTDGQCDPTGTYGTPATDVFVARLSGDLARLEHATYLGGSGEDRPFDVALDAEGHVLVGGQTRSADFPTTAGALDESYNGGTSDAFVSKLDTAPAEDDDPTPKVRPPVGPTRGTRPIRRP